jgi:hypothetical protein
MQTRIDHLVIGVQWGITVDKPLSAPSPVADLRFIVLKNNSLLSV